MTPLRDKAIAAAARDLCPREDVCAYCLQSAEMAVDALLAAGLLGPCGAFDARLVVTRRGLPQAPPPIRGSWPMADRVPRDT